jgi:hypothetical protein
MVAPPYHDFITVSEVVIACKVRDISLAILTHEAWQFAEDLGCQALPVQDIPDRCLVLGTHVELELNKVVFVVLRK